MAGEDYPETLLAFEDRFSTEKACEDYIVALRWPNGFVCPGCDGRTGWRTTRSRLECATCHLQVSITAGTIFHKTRKPLRLWFHAMWWVTSQKYGANALGLQRILGLGSYVTAWAWLHKLRRAMVRPGRDHLAGTVEVDETYVGGAEEETFGRGSERKALVVIAVEDQGKAMGRVRLRRVKDASAESLLPFIENAIKKGSLVQTDGWSGYNGVSRKGYEHRLVNVKQSGQKAHKLLPKVHRVASLLKRWLLGTLQGGVQHHHLDYYLDEFTFRFNRRNSRSRGKLFYRLMEQAVAIGPTTFKQLVGGVNSEPPF